MEKFTKITVGFVAQTYEKNIAGKLVCVDQEFIAGDQVDYEDDEGNTITPPEYECQSFEMPLFTAVEFAGSNQVDNGDVEGIQQADEYGNLATHSSKLLIECFVSEQCSEIIRKELPINILPDSGKLWIQPVGYGDKTSVDGHGWPIAIEIWHGRLRLILFDNIKCEDPQIIDLENAKESNRSDTTD
ncbi:MAG: hypothetical protein FVQ82_17280 [Planctomycetes bacterium]|nr:hypothetical protein [Planctomycetota bacterium]